MPLSPQADQTPVGELARLKSQKAILRYSPDKSGRIIMPLKFNSVFSVNAAIKNSYRISLPDGTSGFLSNVKLENLQKPLSMKTFKKDEALLDMPENKGHEVTRLSRDEELPLFGQFKSYYFVAYNRGFFWIAGSNNRTF